MEIKKYIKYFISLVIPILLSFLNSFILLKKLDITEYGEYSIILVSLNLLTTLLFSWINFSILRLYIKYGAEKKEKILIETGSKIYIILLFLGILISIYNIFIKNYLNVYVVCTVIFSSMHSFKLTYYRIREEETKYLVQTFINNTLKSIFIYIFVWKLNFGIKGALLAIIMSSLFYDFLFILKCSNIRNKVFDKEILLEMLRFGFPLIGVLLTNQLLSDLDKYMLKYYLSDYEVGIYSFYYKISDISIGNLIKLLMLVAYPNIIKTFENFGIGKARKLIEKKISEYIFLISIGIIAIELITPYIIRIFFYDYLESTYLLKYINLGLAFNGLCQYINKEIELRKLTIKLFYLILISLICNILLNVYLIPKYGILGAAFSTILSYIAYLFCSIFFNKKLKNLN